MRELILDGLLHAIAGLMKLYVYVWQSGGFTGTPWRLVAGCLGIHFYG